MREIFLVLVLLLTLFQGAFIERDFRQDRTVVATRQSLRRLAVLTVEVFHGRDPPLGAEFWRAIGRPDGAPILDEWGQEFRMEVFPGESRREFIWESAGPDRRYGTKDDIKVRVPFERTNPDLTQPTINSDSGPMSRDAK